MSPHMSFKLGPSAMAVDRATGLEYAAVHANGMQIQGTNLD